MKHTSCHIDLLQIDNSINNVNNPRAAIIFANSAQMVILDNKFSGPKELKDFIERMNSEANIDPADLNTILISHNKEVYGKNMNIGSRQHLTKTLYVVKTSDRQFTAKLFDKKNDMFVTMEPQITSPSFAQCEKEAIKAFNKSLSMSR